MSRKQKTTQLPQMALAALMAALIAAGSQIAIPLPVVPINLALLAVFIAAFTLEKRWAMAAVLLYLGMGGVGLPVFSGFRGGPQHLISLTGGYLLGYLPAVGIVSALASRANSFTKRALICALGVAACYLCGTLWLMWLTGKALPEVLGFAVIPFIPGDAFKCLAASSLAPRLKFFSKNL